MNSTLEYVLKKFDLSYNNQSPMPLAISNFGRVQLADLLHELDFKRAVEMGVAEGGYSQTLVEANPQMMIYGIDPYEPYRGYRDYKRKSTLDAMRQKAEDRLLPYKNYKFVYLLSSDALKKFKDGWLDFVYIDGNHEEPYISQDIAAWEKKLRPGGILAGHDYFRSRKHPQIQVLQAVHKYTAENNIRPWFVLGNEANNEGLIRDMPRSWMWVKQ